MDGRCGTEVLLTVEFCGDKESHTCSPIRGMDDVEPLDLEVLGDKEKHAPMVLLDGWMGGGGGAIIPTAIKS